MNSVDFFEANKYLKINKFIDISLANLLYYHVLLEERRLQYLIKIHGPDKINTVEYVDHYGTLRDKQVPNNFSKYGDPIFDALLDISIKNVEKLVGKNLISTYSYHRLYVKGAELKKHKDRPSCEISGTLCLGYNISNLENKNWNWPMWIKNNNTEQEIFMEPGDMIIYKGCEVEHWREPFVGINHAQVFFHYNEKDGKFNIAYDGRPVLGLPGSFRSQETNKTFNSANFYKKVIE